MKHIFKKLLFLPLLVAAFASCKKDENRVVFEGGTNPVLTADRSGPMVLEIINKDAQAIRFDWTNPDYKFNTGLSSQDVSYTLQVAEAGTNFAVASEKSIAKELFTTLTVGELNALLLSLDLEDGVAHDMQIRVKSSLINNTAVLYSNVLDFTITPYLDVKYPVPDNLYITGAATPASWQCGCGEPELLSQKFTKINSYTFVLELPLNATQSYLLLPVYGSWSAKYGGTGSSNNTNNVYEDDFKPGGSDLLSPPVNGLHRITVDFKTGKFKLVKL